MSESTARVLGIAVKTERRGPMKEIQSAHAEEGGGLIEDLKVSPKRGITLIDRAAWEATCADLGAPLLWTTRRANVLTEGIDLGGLIGKTIRVGEVELQIGGETDPCSLMDHFHQGLQEALRPDCRGGVYGRVLKGGRIKVGDGVEIVGEVEPVK